MEKIGEEKSINPLKFELEKVPKSVLKTHVEDSAHSSIHID